jgi:hypothetical protein
MEVAVESLHRTTPSSPQAPPSGSKAWAGFYLLAPLFSALPLGWYGAGIAAQFPFVASMLLWTSICMVSWWLSDLASRWFSKLAPGLMPPIACLMAGYAINLLLSSVYNPALLWWMVEVGIITRTSAIDAYFSVNRNLLDVEYLQLLAMAGVPGLFIWLAGNYIFELITGVPRIRNASGYPEAGPPAATLSVIATTNPATPASVAMSPAVATPVPRFFQRMTRLADIAPNELLAIEAEDHYIQVHTTRGNELIYYRFGDAIDEVTPLDGLRIHRSAWISKKAVERVEIEGRNMQVVLSSGARFRVSLSNRGAVLNALPGTQP